MRTPHPGPEAIRNVALKLVETLNATVIPVRRDKSPGVAGWQKLNQSSCQRPCLLDRYGDECPSIAIVAGDASHGLCSIDFDTDEALEEFLCSNPGLRQSLITRGARGANVWIRVPGPCPKLARIQRNGEACGEVRGNGAYTVVWGIHPTGKRYSPNEHLPVSLKFEDLVWPEGFQIGSRTKSKRKAQEPPISPPSSESSASLQFCTSALLHDTSLDLRIENPHEEKGDSSSPPPQTVTPEQLLDHARCLHEASARLKAENPQLAVLYARYIEHRYDARPHERNAVIVQAVPFLYRAVAEEFIPELLRHFWRCHHPLFHATETEHLQEVEAMLVGVRRTFLDELPTAERDLYLLQDLRIQTVYRICRDLAILGKDGPGMFFISAGDLAVRLGVDAQQAHRSLNQLRKLGILRVETPGTQRAKGIPGRATVYRWTLPLPRVPPPKGPAADP